ncbi:hypothetical protein DEA98_13705 [Brucella pseudogrignonensis]|nr:hypothetical protein [Brucella pseudogrignonensis]
MAFHSSCRIHRRKLAVAWQSTCFPGIDVAAYDDMGLAPAVIQLDGLIVSDSYIVSAKALQAAFETPGPGTLVHPWLGPMQVILEETAEISLRPMNYASFASASASNAITAWASLALRPQPQR